MRIESSVALALQRDRDAALLGLLSSLALSPSPAEFTRSLVVGILAPLRATRAYYADATGRIATAAGDRNPPTRLRRLPLTLRVSTLTGLDPVVRSARPPAVCMPLGEHGYLYVDGSAIDASELRTIAEPLVGHLTALLTAAQVRRDAEQRATTDALTGLLNRAALYRDLDEWIKLGEPFGLAFLDLDGFKAINDLRGHEAGDQHLILTARTLKTLVRVPYRLAGDEFVGIVGADESADEITAGLAKSAVAASCGIARYPADGVTSKEMLHAADSAMYRAKQARKEQAAAAPTVRRRAMR